MKKESNVDVLTGKKERGTSTTIPPLSRENSEAQLRRLKKKGGRLAIIDTRKITKRQTSEKKGERGGRAANRRRSQPNTTRVGADIRF